MIVFKSPGMFALCVAILLALPLVGSAKDLYRYINEYGNTVIDDRIPLEYASKGYEILNEEGVITEVVPRLLTEEEMTQRDIEVQLAEAAAIERERLRKWDESLLLRYSTIEDIEAARERSLRDLRIRVSILKSNTRSLKQQVEHYQAVAADVERSGGTVDVKQLASIDELQSEIGLTERAIEDRLTEIERVQAEFQLDIDRFDKLLALVALRRSLLATEQ
jgi:hypothetical protein